MPSSWWPATCPRTISAKLKGLYPHVETTTDLDTMLADYDLDAVVVATSAPSHYAIASKVIDVGQALLRGEAAHAQERGVRSSSCAWPTSAGVVLMVGHLMEYHSAINWIKEYIASGDLGDVLYVYMQRLNLGKVRTEENAFWSLAPHDVSIVLYLLGEIAGLRVSATERRTLRRALHDTVFANLHFPSGKMANIHVRWLDPHKVRKLTVVGSKKMLVFDDMQATEKIWIYDRGVGAPEGAMAYGEDLTLRFGDITVPWVPMKEPLAIEVQHFLDCCVTGDDAAQRRPRRLARRSRARGGRRINGGRRSAGRDHGGGVAMANRPRPVTTSLHGIGVMAHETAVIDNDVTLGHHVIMGADVRIGKGCRIGNHVTIDEGHGHW